MVKQEQEGPERTGRVQVCTGDTRGAGGQVSAAVWALRGDPGVMVMVAVSRLLLLFSVGIRSRCEQVNPTCGSWNQDVEPVVFR